MDQPETNEAAGPAEARSVAAAPAPTAGGAAVIGFAPAREASPAIMLAKSGADALPAQAGPAPCPTCGGAGMQGAMATASYVYALGQIEARFPRPSVEKEMAQATGRAETAGRTDHQALHHVMSQRENRYLARHMCWVLTVQGLETYILRATRSGGHRSFDWRDRAARARMDQHGDRRSRPRRTARLLQRADGPDGHVRSDLHVLARGAHRGDPTA